MSVGIRKPFSVGVVSLCVLVGGLVFASAPASAVAPETPEKEKASAVTATTATLEGVLNPKASGTVAGGEYEFVYRVSESECEGESTAPKPGTGFAAGLPDEPKSVSLTGLQPHQKYTFCLVERNAASEEAKGVPVSFETEAAKPTVESETTALPVKATEATLEAQVNPNNESATYRFEYSTSATGETLNAPVTTLASATVLEGFGNQTASVATGPVLGQGTTYYYRVVATNKTGTSEGTVAHFKTAIAPTPEGLEGEPTGPTTATLKGVLNATKAGEAGTYEFAYRQSASECQRENTETHMQENEKVSPEPAGKSGVSTPEPEETKVTGLLPGAQYTFCLIAHNSVGETVLSSPITFTTLSAAPTIASESAVTVEEAAATLQAEIDPDGAATTYHFEYLSEAQFKSGGETFAGAASTPESASIGADGLDHTVSARITGLEPGKTYHYRVLATNALGNAEGELNEKGKEVAHTLTTPTAPGFTPAQSCPNEQLRAEQPYGLRLPDCRAYEQVSPVEKSGNDATGPNTTESRAAVSGDALVFTSIASFADPVGAQRENQFLSRRGPEGWTTKSLTPPYNADNTILIQAPYEGMLFTPELSRGVATTDIPLTSEAPGIYELYLADFADDFYQWVSNAPLLQEFSAPYEIGRSYFWPMGASGDLSHVVFADEISEINKEDYGNQLYEWIEGRVVDVSVTNNGEPMLNAFAGYHGGAVGVGPDVDADVDSWNAISSNGSRVFFTVQGYEGGAPGPLYVRENTEMEQSPEENGKCAVPTDACTVEISAEPAWYRGASVDGSKVFFTKGEDLYQYDVESGQTKAITLGGKVQGVMQISEDGSYVYFVADGDLGGAAKAGQPNLYVSHDGGTPTFIATLAASDAAGDWLGQYSYRYDASAVSADGTRLAFVSSRSLTGYDNEASNGTSCGLNLRREPEPLLCQEVFEYDAVGGQLVCVSCNPTGVRPAGPSSLGNPYGDISGTPDYRRRSFSDDGSRLFFQSGDALVPQASDGRQNVYEYENGHVYPISNVAGDYESFLLDASASGNDVFFGTADQLVPQDQDDRIDVYDARVGGGFPVSANPPACNNGDSCKPPPAPQPEVFGAPSSATFSGAGNPAPPAVVEPKPTKKIVKCKKRLAKNKKGQCIRKRKRAKKSSMSKRGGKS
jgi:hypothetical protein